MQGIWNRDLKGLIRSISRLVFIYLKLHSKVEIELEKDNTTSKEALSEGKNNDDSQTEESSIFNQVK